MRGRGRERGGYMEEGEGGKGMGGGKEGWGKARGGGWVTRITCTGLVCSVFTQVL